eukprot:4646204-Prymnesium_polylepis.1
MAATAPSRSRAEASCRCSALRPTPTSRGDQKKAGEKSESADAAATSSATNFMLSAQMRQRKSP